MKSTAFDPTERHSGQWLTQSLSIAVLLLTLGTQVACEEKGAGSTSTDSGSVPPKSITVSWTANHAKQVSEAGGGYLVYIAPVELALTSATPISVANPGDGSHITSTTTTLKPGTYNFAVKAFGSDGTSELSPITNFTVPQ